MKEETIMRNLQKYTSPDTGISHYCNNEYLIRWVGMKIIVLHRPTQRIKYDVLVHDTGKIEVYGFREFTGEQFKTEIENEVIKQACLDMTVEIVNHYGK